MGQRKSKKVNSLKENNQVKFLFYGTSDSGRGTLYLQLKHVHQEMTLEERKSYKQNVMNEVYNITRKYISEKTDSDIYQSLYYKQLNEENWIWIKNILNMNMDRIREDLQKSIEEGSSFQNHYYFIQPENLDRFSRDDYIPTEQDILLVNKRTKGYSEYKLTIDKNVVFSIGGGRGSTKRSFENLKVLVFTVALDSYNTLCYEDDQTNQMKENLTIFDEMINSRYLENIPFYLIFTRVDLFKEKIKNQSINVCFKDYKGDNSFQDSFQFIKEKFLKLAEEKTVIVKSLNVLDKNQVSDLYEDLLKGTQFGVQYQ